MKKLLLTLPLFLTGCFNTEPISATSDKFMEKVIVPMVTNGMSEGVKNLHVQGGAQAIQPGYRIKFSGKLVQGIEGDVEVTAIGVAGQVTFGGSGKSE